MHQPAYIQIQTQIETFKNNNETIKITTVEYKKQPFAESHDFERVMQIELKPSRPFKQQHRILLFLLLLNAFTWDHFNKHELMNSTRITFSFLLKEKKFSFSSTKKNLLREKKYCQKIPKLSHHFNALNYAIKSKYCTSIALHCLRTRVRMNDIGAHSERIFPMCITFRIKK